MPLRSCSSQPMADNYAMAPRGPRCPRCFALFSILLFFFPTVFLHFTEQINDDDDDDDDEQEVKVI